MRPTSSSETPVLSFDRNSGSKKIALSNEKITWLHSMSDQPGAKFDIKIKDGLGGLRFERKDFGTETIKAGELINLPVRPGEQLEVEISNIRNAEKVDIFLN